MNPERLGKEYDDKFAKHLEELGVHPAPESPQITEGVTIRAEGREPHIAKGLNPEGNRVLQELRESIGKLSDALAIISPMLVDIPETSFGDISEITLLQLRERRAELKDNMNRILNIIDDYKFENGTPVFSDSLTIAELAKEIEKRIEASERVLRNASDLEQNK